MKNEDLIVVEAVIPKELNLGSSSCDGTCQGDGCNGDDGSGCNGNAGCGQDC